MTESIVQIAAVAIAAVSGAIAVFQLLLACGLPLAAYSWGGKYEGALPAKMRVMSLVGIVILVFMGFTFLRHADVIAADWNIPTHVLVWLFAAYLGLNTLGNAASKSRKERVVMTPLSGLACLCGFVVAIFA